MLLHRQHWNGPLNFRQVLDCGTTALLSSPSKAIQRHRLEPPWELLFAFY
jgi:hypothetical protein